MGLINESAVVDHFDDEIRPEPKNPISDGMFLPNTSGHHTNLVADQITIKKDQGTNDTAYVPMVLHGTDATPPTASNFPVGTIYIQYTA